MYFFTNIIERQNKKQNVHKRNRKEKYASDIHKNQFKFLNCILGGCLFPQMGY